MDPRKKLVGWAAATALAALLPFAPAVLGLRTLSHRDTDQLYRPLRTLVTEALRAGRLPLWNPYEGTGKPLFAEGLHSVLHPISLLGAAVAPASIDFLILAYLVAAALGAFALARALGASPPACAGAGLGFALSGYSVSMTGNLVFLAGLSSLPWLVAAARIAGAGSPWGPAAAALATACAFFTGDAQVAVVGLALGALLAAEAGGRRGLARALAGMVVGLLLSGVQISATQELLPRTYRSLELEAWEKTTWSLAPARLLEWIVPGLFRGPLGVDPTALAGGRLATVFSDSVYLGAPLLVAAGIGAARGRRRLGLLLGVAGGILVWLAMGHHLGARQLLDGVPIWNRFRFSVKLMAPVALCACALGALGIDAFGAGRLTGAWRRALLGVTLAAGALLMAILVAPAATQEASTWVLGEVGPFYRSTLAAGLPHLAVGLGALLAIDLLSPPPSRVIALALLVALAAAAAVYSGAHLGDHEPRRFATPLMLVADSPTPRIAQPVAWDYDRGQGLDHYEESTRRSALLLNPSFNVALRIDTIEPYSGLEPRRLTTLWRSVGFGWTRPFRRFGLTHVVVATPHGPAFRDLVAEAVEGGRLVQRDEGLGFELWAVPHRPWAFFAERAVAAGSPPEAHRALLRLMASGDGGTVIVEAPATPPAAPGRVLAVERGTESVRLEGESDGPALLVIQDAHWPGWRATIDGQPTEILIADLLVRAVRWPPGRHLLELTYDPPGVRQGLALSALGGALLVAMALRAMRRPGRSGST